MTAPADAKEPRMLPERARAGRISIAPARPDKSGLENSLKSGDFEAVAEQAQRRLTKDPTDYAAWRYLHHARMGQRRFDLALRAIDKAIELRPANEHYLRLRAICLKENGRFAEALPILEGIIRRQPDALDVLDALKVCQYRLGNRRAAIRVGFKRLLTLDRLYGADGARQLGDIRRRAGANVVSFGLWGRSRIYLIGAMVNARLVSSLLPGWISRFYVADDVPDPVIEDLRRTNAEIVREREIPTHVPRYFWRFLVTDDPAVSLFLCRDCDSRISQKEVAAVVDWQASDFPFHVMRDHVFHNDLILAGLWGGTADDRLAMVRRIARFQTAIRGDVRYGGDQFFLSREIWPLIRRSVLAHDSYYRLGKTRAFPIGGLGNDRFHVGAGIRSERQLLRETLRFGLVPILEGD